MLGLRGWTDGYAEADQAARWVRTASTLLAVADLLVAGWGVWTMLRAVLDLVSRREVEGQVVRRRSYRRGNDKLDHFMAVDSGRSDKIKAWLVPAAVYGRFREGGVVRMTVSLTVPRPGRTLALVAAWALDPAAQPGVDLGPPVAGPVPDPQHGRAGPGGPPAPHGAQADAGGQPTLGHQVIVGHGAHHRPPISAPGLVRAPMAINDHP
jgi:hypothetical protein